MIGAAFSLTPFVFALTAGVLIGAAQAGALRGDHGVIGQIAPSGARGQWARRPPALQAILMVPVEER